jgi:hypothetical protein
MALSACDLLGGRDGSELIGPQEGRFFGGKQLQKKTILGGLSAAGLVVEKRSQN